MGMKRGWIDFDRLVRLRDTFGEDRAPVRDDATSNALVDQYLNTDLRETVDAALDNPHLIPIHNYDPAWLQYVRFVEFERQRWTEAEIEEMARKGVI